MTDAEIEALRNEMREQRGDIREYLEGEGVDVTGWDEDPISDATPESAESD